MTIELLPARNTGAILRFIIMWKQQRNIRKSEVTRQVTVIKYLSESVCSTSPRIYFNIELNFDIAEIFENLIQFFLTHPKRFPWYLKICQLLPSEVLSSCRDKFPKLTIKRKQKDFLMKNNINNMYGQFFSPLIYQWKTNI